MQFPLSMSDVSLWLAVIAVLLLITSELFSSHTKYFGTFPLDKKRLRLIASLLGLAFLVTVVLRLVSPTII